MITTKADRLIRSLIEAGLSLADFTMLATKVMRIQRDFKLDHEGRRQRDRVREQDKLREQVHFDQQWKEEEERKQKGLAKLRELGYVTGDETYQMLGPSTADRFEQDPQNTMEKKAKQDQRVPPYSKEMEEMKQKQRDCCLSFNIDYDLRLNQQSLERACRRAKRNLYELRADRFNRPEHRSVLSVETATLHNKLKEVIREINKMFLDSKSNEDQRHFQELLAFITQYQGDIDLLMCQMQYEPKVKETILFAPVTTDILDRMNLILHSVRILAKKISTGDFNDEQTEAQAANAPDQTNVPAKVTYIIKVKTNDQASSSLSDETNVAVRLYGTHNKTPDIRLVQSINKVKWQSGQIDLFNIEWKYLGEIYAMEIWHDSEYSTWKVDWVDIIDDAANIYRFPIDRLFDKHSDEKKARFIVQRDTGPVNRLPSKPLKQTKSYKQIGFSTYKVQVKTGKQPNKATDASIFIQLKGENGTFADNLCSANSALKGSVFEPDQLDTFYLVWPNLATISSLHLLIQSDGQHPSWFCEYVIVENSQTGEHYKFIVNQLFDSSNPDDRHAKKHLTVYPEKTSQEKDKKEKEKPSYLLKMKTGESGLGNMANAPLIKLILHGDKGKGHPYPIQSSDKKRTLFRENQTDELAIPSEYNVGPIKALQLSMDGPIDPWFLETIIIRDIAQGQDYMFPIFKWINESSETNNLLFQPIHERKADYIVYTRTISSDLKGPDRAIKLTVQGTKGKNELLLENPVTMQNTFQPGRKDEFYIDNVKSLGDLQTMEVDVSHPHIKRLGLDYIEVKDPSTNESYRFNINRVLDSKNPKMTAKAESMAHPNASGTKLPALLKASRHASNQLLPAAKSSTTSNKKNFDQLTTSVPQGAKRPVTNRSTGHSDWRIHITESIQLGEVCLDTEFKVSINTGKSSSTGIDSKVQLQLHGDKSVSEKITLHKSEISTASIPGEEKRETYSIHTPDIGKLKSATLSINGQAPPQWSISTLEITEEKSNTVYKAKTNPTLDERHLDKSALTIDLHEVPSYNDSKATRSMTTNQSTVEPPQKDLYEIKMKTIKRQFLDKGTRLQIELIDENGQTEMKVLESATNHETTLTNDGIETFFIENKNNLRTLKDVKLSLVRSISKKQDLYQADFIELRHSESNTTYRIDYAKDDILNVDKNRVEIVRSVKLLPDVQIREKTQPQGAAPVATDRSATFSNLHHPSGAAILDEHDHDDLSLSQQTLSKSVSQHLSRDLNSFSEKLLSSSSRQIRPGDRVKTISSKRRLIDHRSTPSLSEGNWYRRSMETMRDQDKEEPFSGRQHSSHTQLDQRTARFDKSNEEHKRSASDSFRGRTRH